MTTIVDGNLGISYPVTAGGTSATQASSSKVLQVTQAVKTNSFASSVGAIWGDISGLSVSITPSSTSSKVLIIVDVKCAGTAGSSIVRSRILRDSTPIYVGDAASNRPQSLGHYYQGSAADNAYYIAQIGGTYLDSPSSVSSITYKVQIGADTNAQTVYVNRTQGDRDTSYYDSRVVSSITLMEIAA